MRNRSVLPAAGAKNLLIRGAFEFLYFTHAHTILRRLAGGLGGILTFHRVRPSSSDPFQPNRRLEIRPELLQQLLEELRKKGTPIVSLEEAVHRVTSQARHSPFVVLTFDDGYRDNLQYAWPILKHFNVPFTVFVASKFAAGEGKLWWLALEKIIARERSLSLTLSGVTRVFDCSSVSKKYDAFSAALSWLRTAECQTHVHDCVSNFEKRYSFDLMSQCRAECMNWEEVQTMARDPRVTIGCHTTDHLMLTKVSPCEARSAMAHCAQLIEAKIGNPVRHLAYPFGDRSAASTREFQIAKEIGFLTAVTTRRGVLFREHADHLTALPRIPVNGSSGHNRHTHVLLSGVPTAAANKLRRLDVR